MIDRHRAALLLAAACVLGGRHVADAGARAPKPAVRGKVRLTKRLARPNDGGRVTPGSGTALADIMAAHGGGGRQSSKPPKRPPRRLTSARAMALETESAEKTAGSVQLRTGLGKDGNPAVAYVAQHPTNYTWRPDVGSLARRVVNLPRFKGRIWINTYRDHPPGWGRDTTSFDVWGFGGRGDSLSPADGDAILDTLFNDPNKPDIDWIIYRGRMWTRATGQWGPSPPGPPDSDPEHNNHLHVTYLL